MINFGLFVLSLFFIFASSHDVYIGMIDVYPTAAHQQIVVLVFADDLEDVLFNELGDHRPTAQNVKIYFKNHLELKINGRLMELNMSSIQRNK
ncbi:MAG: hypothetical protein HC892_17740 [Saprospiraceae bacterium]|nr:hypothetical protein [Saprospiraceae bacterium]